MIPTTQNVAIVTGAAVCITKLSHFGVSKLSQSGMGEALAIHFVSKGWRVACVDLQRGPGEALAASLGPNAHFWEADVADYNSQALMFQEVFVILARFTITLNKHSSHSSWAC